MHKKLIFIEECSAKTGKSAWLQGIRPCSIAVCQCSVYVKTVHAVRVFCQSQHLHYFIGKDTPVPEQPSRSHHITSLYKCRIHSHSTPISACTIRFRDLFLHDIIFQKPSLSADYLLSANISKFKLPQNRFTDSQRSSPNGESASDQIRAWRTRVDNRLFLVDSVAVAVQLEFKIINSTKTRWPASGPYVNPQPEFNGNIKGCSNHCVKTENKALTLTHHQHFLSFFDWFPFKCD